MDSFTVAPELRGTKGDILAAKIEVPILAAMIYGIFNFIRLGWSLDHYFYTYAPVLGGVAADLSPACHPAMGRVPVTFEPKGLGGATGRGAEPSM